MPKPNFKKVTFLCMQQLTNFPYIEEDFDALTNYELLSKVVEYLNKVIANENEQNQSIIELYNSFNDLKNYVDNYFENLDVQDEINNKLDEMVEQGTLQEIIADYLNSKAIFGYDTVADMKEATNLINGSYAKTLGYYAKNDGGSALYKIRTITNDDVVDEMFIIELEDNSLIAELVTDDVLNIQKIGAKNDNSSDCSTHIKKALSKYKTIFIPEGQYKISDNIGLGDEDVEIYGTSNSILINENSDIFTKTSNTGYVNVHDLIFNMTGNYCGIKYDSTVNIQTSNNAIRINNCKFFGESTSSTSTAIYLDGVYNPIITECFFNKINAIYQEISINALISNCTFRECNYAINFNGIGATAASCGDKITECDFTECNVGIKSVTTDWIDISSCIIDYCLYPIILLGQEYGTISNVYTSAKNGNPVIYINKDVSNENTYLNGNNTNTTSKSIVVTNSYISNNLEINGDNSNPNLSADNIVVTCSWFTLNDSTVEKYSRNGINLIDCNNVTIKHTRFTKTASYTPTNPVYSIYGTTSGSNTNYDVANFKYIGIITSDTISRYLADMSQTSTSVFVYQKYGYATIAAGTTSVSINTGLHNSIKNIQLTTSANTKVFYSNVSQDGTSFTANISDTFEYPVQVSWLVKG